MVSEPRLVVVPEIYAFEIQFDIALKSRVIRLVPVPPLVVLIQVRSVFELVHKPEHGAAFAREGRPAVEFPFRV